jgi:hypothetical protein
VSETETLVAAEESLLAVNEEFQPQTPIIIPIEFVKSQCALNGGISTN